MCYKCYHITRTKKYQVHPGRVPKWLNRAELLPKASHSELLVSGDQCTMTLGWANWEVSAWVYVNSCVYYWSNIVAWMIHSSMFSCNSMMAHWLVDFILHKTSDSIWSNWSGGESPVVCQGWGLYCIDPWCQLYWVASARHATTATRASMIATPLVPCHKIQRDKGCKSVNLSVYLLASCYHWFISTNTPPSNHWHITLYHPRHCLLISSIDVLIYNNLLVNVSALWHQVAWAEIQAVQGFPQ
jgi:hypothetical protein